MNLFVFGVCSHTRWQSLSGGGQNLNWGILRLPILFSLERTRVFEPWRPNFRIWTKVQPGIWSDRGILSVIHPPARAPRLQHPLQTQSLPNWNRREAFPLLLSPFGTEGTPWSFIANRKAIKTLSDKLCDFDKSCRFSQKEWCLRWSVGSQFAGDGIRPQDPINRGVYRRGKGRGGGAGHSAGQTKKGVGVSFEVEIC